MKEGTCVCVSSILVHTAVCSMYAHIDKRELVFHEAPVSNRQCNKSPISSLETSTICTAGIGCDGCSASLLLFSPCHRKSHRGWHAVAPSSTFDAAKNAEDPSHIGGSRSPRLQSRVRVYKEDVEPYGGRLAT